MDNNTKKQTVTPEKIEELNRRFSDSDEKTKPVHFPVEKIRQIELIIEEYDSWAAQMSYSPYRTIGKIKDALSGKQVETENYNAVQERLNKSDEQTN